MSGNARPQPRLRAWTLDLTARHLIDKDGVIVALSGAEFRLLRVFLESNRCLAATNSSILRAGAVKPFDRSIDLQ